MKYFRLFIPFVILCLTYIACDSIDDQNSVNKHPTFLPMPERVTVHPLGDDIYIAYTSESDWKINVDYDDPCDGWVSYTHTISNSKGTENITFTVDPNLTDFDIRSCTVKFFTSNGVLLDKFIIRQNKAVIDIVDQNESITMGWKCSNGEFTVKSNILWTIAYDKEGDFSFDFDNDEIKGKSELSDEEYKLYDETVKYETLNNNLDPEDKSVTLTILPCKRDVNDEVVDLDQEVVDNLSRTIKISQNFLIFMINDSREETDLGSFSELGKTYVDNPLAPLNEMHICDSAFTLTSELDWEDLEYDTELLDRVGAELVREGYRLDEYADRMVNVYDLRLLMHKPNPSYEDGEHNDHILRFWTREDEGAFRNVRFSQDPYVFEFYELDQSVDSLKFINTGGETIFRIETTGPWNIDESTIPDWLSVETIEGVGTTDIHTVVSNRNMEFEHLDNAVRFTAAPLNNAVVRNLVAHQDRFCFDLKDVDKTMGQKWSRMNTSVHNFTLVSDGAWTMYLDDDSDDVEEWLDIKATDGSEEIVMDGEHRISGEAGIWVFSLNADSFNNEDYDRTKVIRLTSDLHKDQFNVSWPERAIHIYDIIQQKYVFEIIYDDVDISVSGSTIGSEAAPAYGNVSNAKEYQISLNCGAPWRIINKPDWVQFDKEYSSGDNYENIMMTVANNVGSGWRDSRDGYITVRSYKEYSSLPSENASGEDKRFRIDQEGFIFEVPEAGNDNLCEALNDKEFGINIRTTGNAGWSMEPKDPDSEWVLSRKIEGAGDYAQSITPDINGNLNTRSGSVVIKSIPLGNYSPEYEVNFIQEAYVFSVSSLSSYEFNALKGDDGQAKTISIKCTGKWEFSGVPDGWIALDHKSGEGDKDVRLSVKSTNKSLDAAARKDVTITVKSSVAGLEHTHKFNVSQKPYEFKVDPTSETSRTAISDFEGQVKVTCTGMWKIAEIATEQEDLLTVTKKTGAVEYEMAENYNRYEVTNKFSVVSEDHEDGDALYQEVTLTRKAYEFKPNMELGESNVIVFASAEGLSKGPYTGFTSTGGFQDIDISYSGEESAWLDKSSFDSVTGTLKIVATENKGNSPREAKISIKSNDFSKNKDLNFTYTIGQDGKKTAYK